MHRETVNTGTESASRPRAPKMRPRAAAEYIGCSTSKLAKLRVYGGGPDYLRLSGGLIVYDMDDLDRWLDKHRRNSTSECAA